MGRSLAEEALKPIFYIGDRPIYPIMGASEDHEDESEESEDEESDDQDDRSDESKNPRIKELSDENAKRRNEAKRLQKELEDAQKRLKEIDDAGRSETDRLKAKVEELEKQKTELAEGNQKLAIKNAFLADKTHEWRNPASALKLLDLSEISINDDGDVTGLKDAIKKLADSDSYLLAPKDEDTGQTKEPSGDKTPARKKTKQESSREQLVQRFPGLANR